MSLILDALKKLERDKPTDPHASEVVLLAPVRWPTRSARAAWLAGLAVVLVLAAALAGFIVLRPARRHAPAPAAPLPIASPSPSPRESTVAAVAVEPDVASATTPRGPTPPGRSALPAHVRPTPSPTPASFVLTAIAEQDGHPVAVINDRMVRVGDALEGARIVRIGEGEVELEAGGRRFTVGF